MTKWMTDAMQKATKNPPPDWCDPEGKGFPDPGPDRASWALRLRRGVADELAALVTMLRERMEGAQRSLRLGRSRGSDVMEGGAFDTIRRLTPFLEAREAFLRCAAPWVGRGPKFLAERLRLAEEKLGKVQAEREATVAAARRVQGAAEGDESAEEIRRLHAGVDKRFAAQIAAASRAVDEARADVAENDAAIFRLEKQLQGLRAAPAPLPIAAAVTPPGDEKELEDEDADVG